MKIIRCKNFPPQGYKAMTVLNCIITHENTVLSNRTIRHEEIHWRQEKETLIIFFYLLYFIEFTLKLIIMREWDVAYHAISFEREAYVNETNPEYPNERKHFAWVKYIFRKAYYED